MPCCVLCLPWLVSLPGDRGFGHSHAGHMKTVPRMVCVSGFTHQRHEGPFSMWFSSLGGKSGLANNLEVMGLNNAANREGSNVKNRFAGIRILFEARSFPPTFTFWPLLWTKRSCPFKIHKLKPYPSIRWYEEVRFLGSNYFRKVESSWIRLVPLWKETQGTWSLSPLCEGSVKRQPSINWAGSPH